MKRLKLSRLHIRGFYSKFILICILTLCGFTVLLSVFVGRVAKSYEQEKYLRDYDFALNELYQTFQGKSEHFTGLLNPLYSNYGMKTTGYRALCSLFKDGSLDFMDSQTINLVLQNILSLDNDLVGVLMYSHNTDKYYVFDPKYQNSEPVEKRSDYPDLAPFSVHILSDGVLRGLTSGMNYIEVPVYGISGTIFEYVGSNISILGRIVLLFNASRLSSYESSYLLDPDSLFLLSGADGEIYFSSDGDYSPAGKASLLPDVPERTSRTLKIDTGLIGWNGGSYYNASLYNGRYEFFAQYLAPAAASRLGYTQRLIFTLAVIICLISVGLYLVTFLTSAKKVRIIKKGMDEIGDNRLDYRIKLPKKGTDEFVQIMSGFNMMCDKLQQNVEQSYIHEIKQKRAELNALQTSINPHFLYNTLELIRVQIVQANNRDAAQMVLLLSKIYRGQLSRSTYVTLENEIEQCENLIVLYQYRFGNFEYDFNIPPEFQGCGLPKNTLQPLIENYFVHGIDAAREDNYLEMSAEWIERDGVRLICLTLANDGLPISEGDLNVLKEKLKSSVFESQDMHGFALTNINDSLRLTFGNSYGLFPEGEEGGRAFAVKLIFPPVTPEELEQHQETMRNKYGHPEIKNSIVSRHSQKV